MIKIYNFIGFLLFISKNLYFHIHFISFKTSYYKFDSSSIIAIKCIDLFNLKYNLDTLFESY